MAYSPRRRLEDGAIASFAQVCQLYGIPPSLGRLYALLYVNPSPMSLAELADASGQAKSTTSVSLRKLERYRFVRRLPRGSDRKDYYAAVTDPVELMQDWIRHFVQPELGLAEEMFGSMSRDIGAAAEAGEYTTDEASEMRGRVEEMGRAMELGAYLIQLFSGPEGLSALQALGAEVDPDHQET